MTGRTEFLLDRFTEVAEELERYLAIYEQCERLPLSDPEERSIDDAVRLASRAAESRTRLQRLLMGTWWHRRPALLRPFPSPGGFVS